MARSPQRITQSHLKVLAADPQRFKRLYLDRVELPNMIGDDAAIERGKQFHQLVQQQTLGLPIASIVEADPKLKQYFRAFKTAPPPLLQGSRQSEYPLALPLQNFQLYGVVDLLVETPERAQIVDWKTYRRAHSYEQLATDWQTRLYLCLLAETRDYPPEHLSMLYWFAENPKQWVEVVYDTDTHIHTLQAISTLLTLLETLLATGFPNSPVSQNSTGDSQSIAEIPPLPLP